MTVPGGRLDRPAVCVHSSFSVSVPSSVPAYSGFIVPTSVSNVTSPRSIASASRRPVRIFVIDPISNIVSTSAPMYAKEAFCVPRVSTMVAATRCERRPVSARSFASSSASPFGTADSVPAAPPDR
jgi:hypothetical protein